MSRFNSITEGATVVDIANGVGSYNYYGFIRKNGEWIIMREKTDQTEYRFAFGASDYSTNWTNKASLTYGLPTVS